MARFSFRPALDLRGRKFRGPLHGFVGKPLHPPLTDVPVGAYVIAPLLDVAAYLWKSNSHALEFHRAAGYVLLVGGVISLATALTGFYDWLDTKKGTQIRRMANAHAWTMITMTLVVLVDLALRYLGSGFDHPSALLALLGIAILVLVVIGGTLGGTMVYDYGFNVVNSRDNPVYHPSETDIMHPFDTPAEG
jgi:uncharacterized membrane protein